jgi:beta-phosphoglucomutase-like phosphatase (HAD superfamily)
MKIAIDIDSTLHHYWDQFAAAAKRRFGVDLPYEHQMTWTIQQLRPEQVKVCIAETHAERSVLAAEPYPGAAEAIARWREQGHFIHITSHRSTEAHDATTRWLDRVGVEYDELYCSWDKITRCREIGVDVLIDDSPVNLQAAIDAGIRAATILHPWNRELVEEEDVIAADDWPGLERELAFFLDRP